MRSFCTIFALSSVIVALQATALPHPLVDDSADTSAISDGTTTSPGIANPFPDAGQGAPPNDGSVESRASSAQPAASNDASVVSTPLKLDTSSADTSANVNQAPTTVNTTQLDRPVELTGQLLGMPNCNGLYYDSKWDTCDKETGTLISKAASSGKRHDPNSFPFTGGRHVRREASEDFVKSTSQENNPTILNGLAGVDDGAVPHKQNAPPATKRQPSAPAPVDGSFPPAARERREAQEKAPGNTNFWNTLFEPNEEQSPNPSIKSKRQSLSTGHLTKAGNGPLLGEDQVVDGSQPYPPHHGDEIKRQSHGDNRYWNRVGKQSHGPSRLSPKPEMRLPTARKIINKRQDSVSNNDSPGYLAALGNSNSGLNFEDPSVDPATTPHFVKEKRAQSDLDSATPKHWVKPRVLSRHVVRKFKMNERQVNNASHNQASDHNDPTGYLAALGNAATAGAFDTAGLPKVKQAREEAGQSNFNPAVPHRDGNHVEVGPPGPGGARNIIINRRATSNAQNSTVSPQTQSAVSVDQAEAGADSRADSREAMLKNKRSNVRKDADGKLVVTQAKRLESRSTMMKRSHVQEDAGGKLVVTQAKRGRIDGMAGKRGEVVKDTNGRLIVHQTKQHESDGVTMAPLPRRRERIVKKDNMAQYRHEIPEQEKWFGFGPDYESESESDSGIEAWWGD